MGLCQDVAPRRELYDYAKILLVLCAWHHGENPSINEKTGAIEGIDLGKAHPLVRKLWQITIPTTEANWFGEFRTIFRLFQLLGREEFTNHYFESIDFVMSGFPLQLYNGSNALPPFYINRTITSYLHRHNCSSVLNRRAGVYSLALALAKSEWLFSRYWGQEQSPILSLYGNILLDAAGLFPDGVPAVPECPPDALVSILPVDYYHDLTDKWEYELLHKGDAQLSFLYNVLDKQEAGKVVVCLAHHNIVHEGGGLLLKRIVHSGYLDLVITLPDNVFQDAKVLTSLLFFDYNKKDDIVTFVAPEESIKKNWWLSLSSIEPDFDLLEVATKEEKVSVHFSELEKANYSLNAYVYLQPSICDDDKKLVDFGEIAEVIPCKYLQRPVEGKTILPSSYFKEVEFALRQVVPGSPESQSNIYKRGVGPAIYFRIEQDWSVSACINYTDSEWYIEEFCVAIRPKNGSVSIEYLEWLLLTDQELQTYLRHISEYYYRGISSSLLCHRKVAIHSNPKERDEVLSWYQPFSPKNITYNVLIGAPNPDAFISRYGKILSRESIRVIANASQVAGPSGLESLIRKHITEKSISSDLRADAVLFDAGIRYDEKESEGFDAIISLKDCHRSIPFYAVSGLTAESFNGIRYSYFSKEGRISGPSEDAVMVLVSRLHKELGSIGPVDSIYRSQFPDFFIAAAWTDQRFGMKIAETLSAYFRNNYRHPDDSANRPFNTIRTLTHDLIKEMQKVNLVPPINPGAVPQYLLDKKYYDKSRTTIFVPQKRLMDDKLASSLLSLCRLGSEGSHSLIDGANERHIVLAGFMEFVQWVNNNKELFDNKGIGYYVEQVKGEIELPIIGTVKCDRSRGDDYYYCENVHIFVPKRKPKVKEGDAIVITDVVEDLRNARPELGVTLFAKNEKCYYKK